MNVRILGDILRARVRLITVVLAVVLGLGVMYLALFNQIESQLSTFTEDLPDVYKALIGDSDIASPEGYLQSQMFSLTSPLILSAIAISIGIGLARSERDFTLVPTFFAPVSRRQIALSYLAAVWIAAFAGGLVVFAAVMLGAPLADAQLATSNVVVACLHMVGIIGLAGSMAFGAATATGSPAAGQALGWGLIAVSFIANSVSELVDGARWLGDVSPWGWYGAGSQLTGGWEPLGLILLVVVADVAAAIGTIGFRRRALQI